MNKKIVILSTILFFISAYTHAQNTLDNAKSFLKQFDYTVSVSLVSRSASNPFDDAKLGFDIGIDAKKNIKSYLEDKVDVYGLVGLHYVKKGGKQSSDFMDLMSAGNDFGISQFSIPIHAGGTYNFKKCQLYLDLGPYLAFGFGGTDIEGLSTKCVDFGIGFNIGCKFKKKFGIGVGVDKGFTKIAEYEVTTENNPTGNLNIGDKYSLKSMTGYIRFQWTFSAK